MERLFFLCPNTRRTVDVGVETDIDTLLRIRTNKVRAECPACGRTNGRSATRRCRKPRSSRSPC